MARGCRPGRMVVVLFDIVAELLWFLWPWGSGGSRRARKVLREGRALPATLDALRITRDSDRDERHYVGFTVEGGGAPLRAAVRQSLWPHPEQVLLGSRIVVRERRGRYVVDWATTLRERGLPVADGDVCEADALRRRPIAPGVHDERLDRRRLRKGRRVEADLLEVEQCLTRHGARTPDFHLSLRPVDADLATLHLNRAFVPEYARHLLAPGTRLPVAVQGPSRVAVDWPAAVAAGA